MKKTKAIIIFFMIVLVGGVMAETTMNFLTKGFADTLYCRVNAACNLAMLTVDSLTVYNLSVIGDIFNVTMNLVTWNITESFNVGGNLFAKNITANNYFYQNGDSINDTILWENSTGVARLKSPQDIGMQENNINNASNITTKGRYFIGDSNHFLKQEYAPIDSIAGSASLTLEMKGAVGEVKYWTDALTDAQVVADFNGTINTSTLISHWNMDDNVLDDVSGHDGTIVGVVLVSDNYSEFSSRYRFVPSAEPVLADDINITLEDQTAYAVIIKAA